jgi:glycerol kinase
MKNDVGTKVKTLFVDGGASQNNFLMKFQSDILNCEVVRPKVIETTAPGAAYLAGLKMKYWRDIEDIRANKEIDFTFTPNMDNSYRKKLIDGWNQSVKQARL